MTVEAPLKRTRSRKPTIRVSGEVVAAAQARRLTSQEVPIMRALLLGEQVHLNEIDSAFGSSIERGVNIVRTFKSSEIRGEALIEKTHDIIARNQPARSLKKVLRDVAGLQSELHPPLRDQNLEDVVDSLLAALSRGELETVRHALAPIARHISSWKELYSSNTSAEDRSMLVADLPSILGWFGQYISRDAVAIRAATAISRSDCAEIHAKVSGLLPGQPNSDRLASAQNFFRYLRDSTRSELRITIEDVEDHFTLVPSCSGVLVFVTTSDLIRHFSDGTTRPYGAVRSTLTLSTGHLVDIVLSSARYSRALATLEHELSHATTKLVRHALFPFDLRKESREAAYLDELCAQLSDRFRPMSFIRQSMAQPQSGRSKKSSASSLPRNAKEEIFLQGASRVLSKVATILDEEPCGRDIAMLILKRSLTFEEFLLSGRV